MSIRKEPNGRRSIEVRAEVPGTPEQVWQAIASGPGISAWFVPTRLEGREGGEVTLTFGPGFDVKAAITEWQPPHRFVAVSEAVGDKPGLANEWIVEAKDGSTCTVRIVNSYFTDRDDWDGELEGMESGWPAFFEILRIYLRDHRGQPVGNVQAAAVTPGSVADAWAALLQRVGIVDPRVGARCATAGSAPRLAGEIVRSAEGMLLARLAEPGTGVACLSACDMGGMVMLGVNLYLYGASSAATAEEQAGLWQPWLAAAFPAPQ